MSNWIWANLSFQNDIDLEEERRQVLLITGPNMAGKSTFMRQVALNVLLAQTGCFVAAASAEMTLVDQYLELGLLTNLSQGAEYLHGGNERGSSNSQQRLRK